jgi:predicted cobalt transporter CbtA
MVPLTYIQRKKEQWRTIKWICAVVATSGGVAMLYFHHRENVSLREYNNAISPDVINEKRTSTANNRNYSNISSVVAITGVCGFTVSWIVGTLY